MKKLIYLIVLISSLFSCSEDKTFQEVNTPTFKVTSFEKVLVNGVYNCTATIKITNIPKEYSIDGILYAYDIKNVGKTILIMKMFYMIFIKKEMVNSILIYMENIKEI